MTVSLVVNLANGMSVEDIIHEYPELEREDVRQALQYASALANQGIGFKTPRRETPCGHGRFAPVFEFGCSIDDTELDLPPKLWPQSLWL